MVSESQREQAWRTSYQSSRQDLRCFWAGYDPDTGLGIVSCEDGGTRLGAVAGSASVPIGAEVLYIPGQQPSDIGQILKPSVIPYKFKRIIKIPSMPLKGIASKAYTDMSGNWIGFYICCDRKEPELIATIKDWGGSWLYFGRITNRGPKPTDWIAMISVESYTNGWKFAQVIKPSGSPETYYYNTPTNELPPSANSPIEITATQDFINFELQSQGFLRATDIVEVGFNDYNIYNTSCYQNTTNQLLTHPNSGTSTPPTAPCRLWIFPDTYFEENVIANIANARGSTLAIDKSFNWVMDTASSQGYTIWDSSATEYPLSYGGSFGPNGANGTNLIYPKAYSLSGSLSYLTGSGLAELDSNSNRNKIFDIDINAGTLTDTGNFPEGKYYKVDASYTIWGANYYPV